MVSDFQVVQTPGQIVMAWEFSHAYRIVRLDRRGPLPAGVKLAMGHSVGRWEGNTLVVETTNINDWDWFDYTGTFHTDAMSLSERFTVVDANTIDYEVTIDDPNLFTRPWKVAGNFSRAAAGVESLEFACAEGSQTLVNIFGEPPRR
jgi:hypothetical protein